MTLSQSEVDAAIDGWLSEVAALPPTETELLIEDLERQIALESERQRGWRGRALPGGELLYGPASSPS